MKKTLFAASFAVVLLCCFLFLSGCLKDECANTYTIYRPVYKSLTQVRADMRSSTPQPLQQTGKLYLYGKYIFLNELGKGIHIIDNSNPAQPKNISFIAIPGNVDLAVKGNFLYADSYSDLVVFDISDPDNVTAKKFVNNIFPNYRSFYWGNSTNPDSVMVVVGYTQKDTTVDCGTYRRWSQCANCATLDASGRAFYTAAAPSPVTGKGGSMARFTIVNNYLYSVTTSQLYSFNISNATEPQLINKKDVGWNIETIYPFSDKLFIGSTTGMFIYSMADATNPSLLGQFSHVRSCDPVIADDTHAYVTLRSGTACQGFTNQLEVLSILDVTRPTLLKTYPMTNPHGLSKDEDLLFICDGKDGLKIYDAAHASNIKLIKTISGLDTYDVITDNGIAIVVAQDGLYQFDYTNRDNIRQISKLSLSK